jgi:hypothetical protein
MEPLAEKALRAVENGQLTILPERFEKVLMNSLLLFREIVIYSTFMNWKKQGSWIYFYRNY